MYTSLKLSKKLADNGFEGESEKRWVLSKSAYDDNKPIWYLTTEKQTKLFTFYKRPRSSNYKFGKMNLIAKCDYEVISEIIYAYDILNSLCVKYSDDIFPKDFEGRFDIMVLLQQNKQDEAEEYIWEHCLFNPNNK